MSALCRLSIPDSARPVRERQPLRQLSLGEAREDAQVAVLAWQGAQGCGVGIEQRQQDRRDVDFADRHRIGTAIAHAGSA